MGNLIALMSHLRPRRRVPRPGRRPRARRRAGHRGVAGRRHAAAAAARRRSRQGLARTRSAARRAAPGPYYTLRTTLLCLENTHNAAGGTVTAPEEHAAVAAAARAAQLRVHLDGARLWHAAVALGVPAGDPDRRRRHRAGLLEQGPRRAGRLRGRRLGRVRRRRPGGCARCSAAACARAGCWPRPALVAPGPHRPAGRGPRAGPDAGRRACASAAGRSATPQTNIVLVPVADLDGTLRRFADAGVLASADGRPGAADAPTPTSPTPTSPRRWTGSGRWTRRRRSSGRADRSGARLAVAAAGHAPVRPAGR